MTKVVKVILEAETGKANANLNKVNKSLKKTEKQAKETSGAMTSSFNALPASIQGAIGQVKNLGTSFKALAVGGGVAAVAGLGSLFVMATQKGAEFAQALSGLESVLGASDAEMNQLSNSAKELGASTQFTSKQVVELQTEFAKLGFSTKEILASTKATLDLAASLDVGLGEAAMIAGSTLRAFGLEAEETQRVVDVMASSTSKSALDYDALRESLKLVAPTSRALNVDIEETTALLATLADNGLKGSVAGTGLSKTFIELNKKGIPLNEALERVKNSSNSLNEAIDLVGVVGSKSLLTLANNAPKIDTLTKSFRNSQGAAQRLAETRLDNLAGDTTKLGSAWEGFLLSIEDGEGLFNSIARGIVQATTNLLGFITPSQELADTYFQQVEAVNTLESSMTPLLTRYDELATKTDLSNTEQEELDGLILKIAQDIPQAVTQFDEYGKAMGISTEAAKKFLKESKDILKIQNRPAIEEQQDAIESLNDKLKIYGNALEKRNGQFVREVRTYTKLGGEIISYVKLTTKEILARSNRRKEIKEEIDARTAMIAKLKGEKTAAELLLEEKDKNAKANEGQTVVIRDLIKEQEELLEQAEKLPQSTEAELAVKNKKIKVINTEIKRLKSLGVEKAKQIKNTRDLILLKQQELKEIQNTEAKTRDEIAARNDKVKAIQAEIKELQNLKTAKFNIEKIDTESLPKLEKREAQKVEVRTSSEELVARNIKKINKGRTRDDVIREDEAHQRRMAEANTRIDIASNALGSIGQLADAFARGDEARAKKAFKINKAVGIAQATISTAQGIMNELSHPVKTLTFTNYAAAAAMALAGAAQIATISTTKFNSSSGTTPTTTDNTGGGSLNSATQPPSFNVVGQSGFNQVAGALSGQQPVQAYVVAGNVTTAQQLQNNTITQATF